MKYNQEITLKNGRAALLRNGVAADAAAVVENLCQAHAETDYLLSYPDECSLNAEKEAALLGEKTASANEIEIVAFVDAGTAGIKAVGSKYKLRHRSEFGISILRKYWGLGLGRALTQACIQCAREAGYAQLELTAVAENARAVELYKKAGFVEYGRNPLGFNSRESGYQEIVLMRLKL